MKNLIASGVVLLLIFVFVSAPVWATCGGGGGGGGGGMSGSGSGGNNSVVYHVPWQVHDAAKPVASGMILYWFPASLEELRKSPLRESRELSLYAAQCVRMELADAKTTNVEKLVGTSKAPFVVLANPDATVIGRVDNKAGKVSLPEVEKLVGTEMKTRKANIETTFKDAKTKASAGDKDGAIRAFQTVVAERCMFADKAKDAVKELKKLGVENVGSIADEPVFDPNVSARIMQLMKRGLRSENAGRYVQAERLYAKAQQLDPADPTPLRYLGELHRHHTGDWEAAKKEFHQILNMRSDPLSRSVALQGLGKITIHEGEFLKGMHLMEDSVAEYPIALAYRNLAVYWNSEGDLAKGNYYTDKALAMDPTDPYNLIFAAVFMAASGKKDEALKVARKHINLLPASYNLAAIYAQNGDKEKALKLLHRHFYTYERYHSVRSKEMMEARVDAVFASLRDDKDFLALTKHADGMLPMPMSPKAAEQMKMDMKH